MEQGAMTEELVALLEKIKSTADFSYVDFDDVNATNCLGENALHIAVRWGDLQAVKLLIQSGVDINKHGEEGYTPLHYACAYANPEMVELLLQSGANPEARTEGYIPFTVARLHGKDENCEALSSFQKASPSSDTPSPAQKHAAALSEEIEALEEKINEQCK
jgi:ankyrin repeat protein